MKIAQNRYRRRKLDLDGVSRNVDSYKNLSKEYKELQAGTEKLHKFDPDNIVSIEK
jgi:hypothetical protein